MSLPHIASREEWLAARTALLAKEKELTRQRDRLNAQRRMLPMVEIDKRYVFDASHGEASLLDLFEGRSQLIGGHFMLDPSWDDGCASCSAGADEDSDGLLRHLHARDTTLAYVSRAGKIADYKARKGWAFPWYSSHGSDFNYDFHVTLDAAVASVQYHYRRGARSARRRLDRRSRAAADRDARHELLPAPRRARLPHVFDVRPRRSRPAARTTSSTSRLSAARRSGRSPPAARRARTRRVGTSRSSEGRSAGGFA